MTVTLNRYEILHRANGFMREFADAHYEMGEAQNFIRGLCDVFGFSHKRLVSFEQRVKKLGGGRGRIDGFYPGQLLIEMKSRGEKLDVAYQHATDYLPGLRDVELPEYLLVSDFEHMRLYRLDGATPAQTRDALLRSFSSLHGVPPETLALWRVTPRAPDSLLSRSRAQGEPVALGRRRGAGPPGNVRPALHWGQRPVAGAHSHDADAHSTSALSIARQLSHRAPPRAATAIAHEFSATMATRTLRPGSNARTATPPVVMAARPTAGGSHASTSSAAPTWSAW
jgi:hypothetical protein